MSVLVTLRIAGNPRVLEEYATDHGDELRDIVDAAKRHGLIAHRFYGSDDGTAIMVVDEWPHRQSFEAFFAEQMPRIEPMMRAAGATGQPEPAFWEELKTRDAYGWNA